jgi:hypothetical protein
MFPLLIFGSFLQSKFIKFPVNVQVTITPYTDYYYIGTCRFISLCNAVPNPTCSLKIVMENNMHCVLRDFCFYNIDYLKRNISSWDCRRSPQNHFDNNCYVSSSQSRTKTRIASVIITLRVKLTK